MAQNVIIKNNVLSVLINLNGCAIESLLFKNKFSPLMQLNSSEMYGSDPSFSGAMVGPYCGRIKNANLNVNSAQFNLTKNEGETHLHGGFTNLSNVKWDICYYSKEKVSLKTTLLDKTQGYPGNRDFYVTYSVFNNSLLVEIEATSDRDTVFNITNHSYWNLSCDFSKKIFDHKFKISSSKFYSNDLLLIPQKQCDVKNTSFDFNKFTSLKQNLSKLTPKNQLIESRGYNHVFDASGCEVISNNFKLDIKSSFANLLFYSGGFLNSNTLLNNNVQASSNCAFAIEPQHLNQRSITKPNETYKQFIQYSFFT